jgi:hypothetical protein
MTEHEPPRSASLELTTDEVYDYLGYSNCESRCRVRFYEAPGPSPVLLVEELQDNPGTSITNMVEYLAAELAARHCPQRLEEPEPFRWIERYPRTERERRQGMVKYSLVTSPPTARPWSRGGVSGAARSVRPTGASLTVRRSSSCWRAVPPIAARIGSRPTISSTEEPSTSPAVLHRPVST